MEKNIIIGRHQFISLNVLNKPEKEEFGLIYWELLKLWRYNLESSMFVQLPLCMFKIIIIIIIIMIIVIIIIIIIIIIVIIMIIIIIIIVIVIKYRCYIVVRCNNLASVQ